MLLLDGLTCLMLSGAILQQYVCSKTTSLTEDGIIMAFRRDRCCSDVVMFSGSVLREGVLQKAMTVNDGCCSRLSETICCLFFEYLGPPPSGSRLPYHVSRVRFTACRLDHSIVLDQMTVARPLI